MVIEKIRRRVRKFAYGCNVYGDTSCPSLAAFPHEPGTDLRLYGRPGLYDDLVRSFIGDDAEGQGEVDEELAREKWLTALREIEREPLQSDETKREIDEHRLVAEKLGWIASRE